MKESKKGEFKFIPRAKVDSVCKNSESSTTETLIEIDPKEIPATNLTVTAETGNDITEQQSQKEMYANMVADLRSVPSSIHSHIDFINDILDGVSVELSPAKKNIFFSVVIKTKDDEVTIQITDFGVVVLQVNIIHTLENVSYQLELLIFGKDKEPNIVYVDSLELGSSTWLERLGVWHMYKEGSSRSIRKALKTMTKLAPITKIYHYSGWAIHEPNVYILDGQEICSTVPVNYDEKTACEYALSMFDAAERRITFVLLPIATLSLVQSKMEKIGYPFKGTICMEAQSQSFKTTVAAIFYDFKKGTDADVNFESTEVAIVRTIGNKRDSVPIVDDAKPPATRALRTALMSKFEKIIRIGADSSNGYQKAGQNNSIISNKSTGITLITAEEIPVAVYSSLARLLIIKMNRQSSTREKVTYFQANHHKYRAFVEHYIHYIIEYGVDKYCNDLANRFVQERNTLREVLLDKDIQIDNRTNDMGIWLYISFDEFLKYVLKVNAIQHEEYEGYKYEALNIYLALMEEQAERINELDDISRFFKGLRYLLDTKETWLEQLQARNSGFSSSNSKFAIGFKKSGYVYLKNNIAFQKVVDYYQRFGSEFAVSETTLRRLLNDNGYIVPKKPPKVLVHRLYVDRKTYQCIMFTEAAFDRLLKGGKTNDSEGEGDVSDNRELLENANNFLGRGV